MTTIIGYLAISTAMPTSYSPFEMNCANIIKEMTKNMNITTPTRIKGNGPVEEKSFFRLRSL